MKVKTGDTIFFRTKFRWHSPISWLSALIRLFAKIEYNHVGVIIPWEGKPMVVEAIGRGIIATPLVVRAHENKVLIVRPNKKINKSEYTKVAVDYLGHTKYDVIGLIWHQLVWNISGYRKWVGDDTKAEARESFYCYEFAAMMEGDKDFHKVKPKEYLEREREIVYQN